MVPSKIIAERLIDLRGDRAKQDVANAIGISYSALSMYERGERVPRDDIKLRLAQYYDRSVEEIFFADNVHEM